MLRSWCQLRLTEKLMLVWLCTTKLCQLKIVQNTVLKTNGLYQLLRINVKSSFIYFHEEKICVAESHYVHIFSSKYNSNPICKVHSFIEQLFAWSSIYSIRWYFQLMSAEFSLKISCHYHQNVSTEDHAKHCLRNECTLAK